MSIETLLEAARFLEWQAQQQLIAREENGVSDKVSLDREMERRCTEVSSLVQSVRVNHVTWGEESHIEVHPSPIVPPPLQAPMPIAVIPIPVVSALPLPAPGKDALAPAQQQRPLLAQVKTELVSFADSSSPQPQSQHLPSHPGAVVTGSQHTLHPGTPVMQGQVATAARPSSVVEDSRQQDLRRRPGGAGTREVHNKLEKNRRAHLKECFETLKRNIPNVDEKKTSNLGVLRSALRYIQTLKRKEKEYEHEMERLAREKIATQQRLGELRSELSQWLDGLEMERLLRQAVQPEDDQASTSTASEGEDHLDQAEEEPVTVTPASLLKVAQQPVVATMSVQHTSLSPGPGQAMVAHPHLVTQPTVIAHAASVSHASVIQAVSHVIQAGHKHVAHIAPSSSAPCSSSSSVSGPIGHITVHPVAHLGPALYSQQPAAAVVSHIAHTLSHAQVNGTSPGPGAQAAALVGKQQVVARHSQLVGGAVLNPVTMVTMPSFPVSGLKLA